MRRKLPVLLSVLLLTACGTQPAGHPTDTACVSQPVAEPSQPESGVRITGVSPGVAHCAEFEVTNTERHAAVYTVTFAFLADSGEALSNPKRTVPTIGPGRTMRYTINPGELRAPAVRVKVIKVRSVPAAEAPSTSCPPSGLRTYADDDADAAMGLRDLGIHLENCGKHPVRLTGYPQLQLLDEDHKPVPEVRLLHAGGPPHPFDLKPGERASAHLIWRNTTESDAALNLPYARLRANADTAPVMITPEFDLGTTGKLTIHPWKKEQLTS
jgi:uncharacterized protein DUF4232